MHATNWGNGGNRMDRLQSDPPSTCVFDRDVSVVRTRCFTLLYKYILNVRTRRLILAGTQKPTDVEANIGAVGVDSGIVGGAWDGSKAADDGD